MIRVAPLLIVAGLLATAQTQQQFRSTTTRVAIDVAVFSRNQPVADLASTDFTLTDNGVQQTIEVIALTAVPLDVSLVVDVSGSTARLLDAYSRDVAAISAMLRPIDRMRVIGFQSTVQELLPLTDVKDSIDVTFKTGAASSVYDGVASAMMKLSEPGRRHLIVAFTDGGENASVLTGDQIMRLAKTSEAVLHVVTARKLPLIAESNQVWCSIPDPPAPLPPCAEEATPLQNAAESTGGAVHIATQLAPSFQTIFNSFLNSYVLYYQPARVSSKGWHDVVVKVTRRGEYSVRARRGYFAG